MGTREEILTVGENLLAKRREEEAKEAAKKPSPARPGVEEPPAKEPATRELPDRLKWKKGDKLKLFEDHYQIVGFEVLHEHSRGRFMIRLIQEIK